MLKDIVHWVEIAAGVFDFLLLARILMLRLHRTYLFITLACFLEFFFDAVQFWVGSESQEMARVFYYSRYLYLVLFPLVVWDVFEEVKTQIVRVRRMALARLVSGMVLMLLFALVIIGMAATSDDGNPQPIIFTMGFLIWMMASAASFAFLWSLHRKIRADKIELPNNTFVWLTYYMLALAGVVLSSFAMLVAQYLSTTSTSVMSLIFLCYGMAISGWCIVRLRGTPSDVPSAPENASL